MKRTTAACLAALALPLLAACGGGSGTTSSAAAPGDAAGASATPTPTPTPAAADLAPCYTGKGTSTTGEKLVATLRLSRGTGTAVSGVYLVGEKAGAGMTYTVAGTLTGRKLDAVFTAAGQGVQARGTASPEVVDLDNPDGLFAVTKFTAGCG